MCFYGSVQNERDVERRSLIQKILSLNEIARYAAERFHTYVLPEKYRRFLPKGKNKLITLSDEMYEFVIDGYNTPMLLIVPFLHTMFLLSPWSLDAVSDHDDSDGPDVHVCLIIDFHTAYDVKEERGSKSNDDVVFDRDILPNLWFDDSLSDDDYGEEEEGEDFINDEMGLSYVLNNRNNPTMGQSLSTSSFITTSSVGKAV